MHQAIASITRYDHNVFAGLNEFEIAQKELEPNKKSLEALGAVICRYRLQDIVGVSLLHKHFDIAPSEVIVREFVDNEAYTKPFLRSEKVDAVPYMWKLHLDEETGKFAYFPLEFLCPDDRTKAAESMTRTVEQSQAFLSDFASALLQLGLQEVFGISTLHHDSTIKVTRDEFLSETTDYENRTLRIRPEVREASIMERSAETLWRFTLPEGVAPNPEVSCDVSCTGRVTAAMHCTCGPHHPSVM